MPATIQPGSTGDDVKRLQRVLARRLLWNPFGPITGLFDGTLESSVKAFQQSNGLAADGVVGPSTWAKLPPYREASPTVALGSLGPVVAWLQRALAGKIVQVSFAPYADAIDGIFGPLTEASVKALQTWAQVPATGVVDDASWFVWLTPGSAQQLSLEGAAGLLNDL